MNSSQKELPGGRVGWMARYFLRRLALARRDPRNSATAAYSNALFELTLVVVLMPCLAIFSCVLIASVKWAPTFARAHPNFSPKVAGLVIGFLAFGAGNVWLRRRFRELQVMPSACAYFDTKEDRRVACWQKLVVVSVCGAVIPLLAIAVTFWIL